MLLPSTGVARVWMWGHRGSEKRKPYSGVQGQPETWWGLGAKPIEDMYNVQAAADEYIFKQY